VLSNLYANVLNQYRAACDGEWSKTVLCSSITATSISCSSLDGVVIGSNPIHNHF